jgi:hypothetical protein
LTFREDTHPLTSCFIQIPQEKKKQNPSKDILGDLISLVDIRVYGVFETLLSQGLLTCGVGLYILEKQFDTVRPGRQGHFLSPPESLVLCHSTFGICTAELAASLIPNP